MDAVFLSKTNLFRGIPPAEIMTMLGCLKATTEKYRRGEVICAEGTITTKLGMVLSGSVSIENNDIWGNKSILDKIGAGQVFAENYACVPGEAMMISVAATEQTEVLWMSAECMFTVCTHACASHQKLVRNMLTISAQKSLNLSRRILHTSSKSIRGRLLSFLSFQAAKNDCREFDISFNRQQLADYLSVDRSSLSNELSKMQKEGILTATRNHFILHDSGDM